MFYLLLLLTRFFSVEAAYNHRIYDVLIVFEQVAIPQYKSNIYFNDHMSVKEIKAVIRRNEGIAATIDKIRMYREGEVQEMKDIEILGASDKGARSLVVKVPY